MKSIIAKMLLFVLVTSLFSTAILIVSADRVGDDGVGKYVDIDIVGGGAVTVTKLSSYDQFESPYTDDMEPIHIKVGAGDVMLEAESDDEGNWAFDHWNIIDGQQGNLPDEVDGSEVSSIVFKTSKGVTGVEAVFSEVRHITVRAYGPGNIEWDTTTLSDGELIVPVEVGDSSPVFSWVATGTGHISSVIIDSVYQSSISDTSYQFEYVAIDHTISVIFSYPGEATVLGEDGAIAFLNEEGSLTFSNPGEGGIATGGPLDFPEGTSILLWEISGVNWEDWAFYDGGYVIIGITLEGGARPQHMYTVESIDQLEILNSDVDNDGDIDHDDMVLMARALSNKEEGIGREYDPIYDVDENGVLNQDDLETLQANMGTSLEEFEIE